MRLRFWRRPKRYITLPQPPAGLMAGDVMYLSAPKDATPPPGWTWDDNHGWHKTVTPADPQEVQSELTALRERVVALATKHAIPPEDLYATLGGGDV